jgi:hypothetical protein
MITDNHYLKNKKMLFIFYLLGFFTAVIGGLLLVMIHIKRHQLFMILKKQHQRQQQEVNRYNLILYQADTIRKMMSCFPEASKLIGIQECPICYNILDGKTWVAFCPSNAHFFHRECIEEMQHFSPCPICKTKISEATPWMQFIEVPIPDTTSCCTVAEEVETLIANYREKFSKFVKISE